MAAKKKTTTAQHREKVQRKLKSLNVLSVHVLNRQALMLERIACALERSAKALEEDIALRQEARASQLELQKRSITLLENVASPEAAEGDDDGPAN